MSRGDQREKPLSGEFPRLLALGLSLLLLLAGLAWPIAVGKVYGFDDLSNFHLPLREFYSKCLTQGVSPWWCPELFCGFYLHGEGQVGLVHPLHLALYRILQVAPAFVLEVILPMPLAFGGLCLFLRRHGLPWSACGFAGLIFGFSGYLLYHYIHPNSTAVAAHIPWLLLATDWLIQATSKRTAAQACGAIAALTGSQFLLGHPQTVLYSLVAESTYLLVVAGRMGLAPRMSWATLAKCVGLGLGAVQLLPTMDLMSESFRAAVPPEFSGLFSLHPANLHQWFVPLLYEPRVFAPERNLGGLVIPACTDIGHGQARESGLYNSAILPVLMMWCLIRRKSLADSRRLLRWALLLSGLGLVLAMGSETPLFELTSRTPGLNLFRAPARFLLLTQLGTVILAAHAFADLIACDGPPVAERNRRWLAVPLGIGAWIVLTVHGLADRFPETFLRQSLAQPRWALLSLILLGSMTWIVGQIARGKRLAVPALILLTAADVAGHSVLHLKPHEVASIDQLISSSHPLPKGSRDRVHVEPPQFAHCLRWLGQGRGMLNGYAALIPSRAIDFSQTSHLRLASVRRVFGEQVRDIPDPLPWARLVSETRLLDAPLEEVLERTDLGREALVEQPLPVEPGPPGRIDVLTDGPSSFHFRTEVPTRQLLVLSERFHPGWTVKVNGRSHRVFRVNGEFMGCVVRPADRDVRWEFHPRSLRLGARWSALSALVVVGLLTLRRSGSSLPPGWRVDRGSSTRGRHPDSTIVDSIR